MTWSHQTRFIGCRNCNLLQPVLRFDGAEAHPVSEALVEAVQQFLVAHDTHDLAWFHRHGSEAASDRALWDPMATVRFEATDGQHLYVVTGARTALEEPRVYRFAPGALDVSNTAILVDDTPLRRGLDLEFYPQAVRLTKLERFVSAVHEVISHVNPDELAIAFDDAEDPAVSIARMPDQTYEELVARCAEIFDPAELGTVSRFLRDNRDEDGLLALRVRREFRTLSA